MKEQEPAEHPAHPHDLWDVDAVAYALASHPNLFPETGL
jgi:hypothetical protein